MLTRRQRRRRNFTNKKNIAVTMLMVFVCSLAAWFYSARLQADVPVAAGRLRATETTPSWMPQWQDILFLGIPGLAGTADRVRPASPVAVTDKASTDGVVHGLMLFFTQIDLKDWRSVLRAEIPVLAAVPSSPSIAGAMTAPVIPKFNPITTLSKDKPVVGIYHTHTAEAFVPTSGVAHKPGGQIGDIVGVGETMVNHLGTLGIPAIQSKNIHDYPSFMKAYGVSENTVRQMLEQYPSLQVILDIHRDAGKREDNIVTINGVTAAKITIIVATGQADLPQPTWQQNHAFAKSIEAKLNQYYPGLSKGILLVEWRYNQHLHPRALLVEVGSQETSKEEADRSIELLSNVIAQIISENG